MAKTEDLQMNDDGNHRYDKHRNQTQNEETFVDLLEDKGGAYNHTKNCYRDGKALQEKYRALGACGDRIWEN